MFAFAALLALAALPQDPTHLAATATNAFAVDLYQQLAEKPDGNLFLSPWSIATVLTMATEGARGETAAEMRRVLHLPEGPLADVHASIASLREQLATAAGTATAETRKRIADLRIQLAARTAEYEAAHAKDPTGDTGDAAAAVDAIADELRALLAATSCYELQSAQSLWFDHSVQPVPAFTKALEHFYVAGMQRVDFCGASEAARLRVNAWVADRTAQKIPELIQPGRLSAGTRFLIVNATHFRGEWVSPFVEGETSPSEFTKANGTKVAIQLMHDANLNKARFAAFTSTGEFFATPRFQSMRPRKVTPIAPAAGGFQIAALPYRGDRLEFVVLLPDAPDGLTRLEQLVKTERLPQWLARLERRAIDFALPRFELQCRFQLKESLQALGMRRAFQVTGGQCAQFDGIAIAETLRAESVTHMACIEVNEKGTEAVAATTIGGTAIGLAPEPVKPVFRADRPFLFLIRDHKSGVILFLGRVVDPEMEK